MQKNLSRADRVLATEIYLLRHLYDKSAAMLKRRIRLENKLRKWEAEKFWRDIVDDIQYPR